MKRTILRILPLCLLFLAGSHSALAQAPTINTTVYKDRIRFESLESARELRIEVFNAAGQKLFDSGFVSSQTIDWNMLDQQGEAAGDGVYDYLVTTKKRSGKSSEPQLAQLSILREGRDLDNAPALVQPAAPGQGGGGSGNVTGSGTAGQIIKWTGTSTLADSILTEKDGKIGLGNTNPISLLHILGSHPTTSTLAGTNATEGLRIIGGKGGDTSGAGQTAGNGANLVLQAGDGGDALTGTSGKGGFVTIQPGGAGVGSISGGFGQLLLAPGGGNVGIGVTNAASKLTVAGMIETTMGGLKFPDGSTQTTAAITGLTSISHDATLAGNGTSGSPLGVADSGIGTSQLANNAVTASKIATGQVVTGLNGLKDQVSLNAGSNITITPSGNGLTIAAPNSLTSVAHETTLAGNGTSASPLGLAVPLRLQGSSDVPLLEITNLVNITDNDELKGIGVEARGGSGVNLGGTGVFGGGGFSNTGTGGTGVVAVGGNTSSPAIGGTGIFAQGGLSFSGSSGLPTGRAGDFRGDVGVTGNLFKGGGSFKIDHPLDPANKYLYHSFVESPDMKNVYDGIAQLDANGSAVVELPEWFEALNKEFRYLVTPIGAPMPGLYIAEKVSGNRFRIAGGQPGLEVSWQVTGIRQDAYANHHRIPVEEPKPEAERGTYLHPDVFNQPEERDVEWAHHPELMKRLKQQRVEEQRPGRNQ